MRVWVLVWVLASQCMAEGSGVVMVVEVAGAAAEGVGEAEKREG